MESQFADVLQGLAHLLHFAGGHEADGVPVPLVVEDAVVQSDRPVGGDQVIWERALTSGRYMELLSTLLQMHFGGCTVSALDVDRGVRGQVGDEVALAKLVNSLLDGDDLKGAQGLGGRELLHV